MPPIVALIVGESPVSMVPVLSKPLPVMTYVTKSSVTPGTTSRLTPTEPICSAPPSSRGSLEQPSSGTLAPSNDRQTRGTLPSLVTNPNGARPCFIDSNPFVRVVRAGHTATLGRLGTGLDVHDAA